MTWNVSPEIVNFGLIHVRWYGLIFAMGFLTGYWILGWILERESHSTEHLDTLLVMIIVGTITGARLGHCLLYEPGIYLRDPLRILKVWEGGLASHGAAIGIFTAVWLWRKKYLPKVSMIMMVDYVAVPLALVSAMVRIGNFFNSEILGRATDLPWGIVFARIDRVPRHPSQLYEAFWYASTFFIARWVFLKGWHRGRPGLLFGLCFSLTTLGRFLIEFLKERQEAFEYQLPLDMGQILTIPFFLLGVFFFVRALKMEPNKK